MVTAGCSDDDQFGASPSTVAPPDAAGANDLPINVGDPSRIRDPRTPNGCVGGFIDARKEQVAGLNMTAPICRTATNVTAGACALRVSLIQPPQDQCASCSGDDVPTLSMAP